MLWRMEPWMPGSALLKTCLAPLNQLVGLDKRVPVFV